MSETEEEFLSNESDEKGNKKGTLSKYSEMFKKIYEDHFDLSTIHHKYKSAYLSQLGDDPISEDSRDSDDSSFRQNRSFNSLSF